MKILDKGSIPDIKVMEVVQSGVKWDRGGRGWVEVKL